ncbi:DUF3649 domain-containing protein [Coralloluteibacterium stylophorae]|uniref:DUF3649 domain-containing protein n=1 Tax=Coralloluteibacterium stylophorae TaxID=1776034 RepID=A0A8J7VUR1_9GAMM|nr:DUF3649 domain-containing protein [Coralloluteibacterium stylophorae]MBS7458675.1 DUF3649 domain-containing protein [Coralloluteibacterium stylophorae]
MSATAAPGIARRRPATTRWGVAARVVAAFVAGYFVAWGATAFLVLVLPMGRADRVVTASLLSFAVWCAAALYAFGARTTWRAWWVLLALGVGTNALAYGFAGLAARP